jgi:septum formation protein
MAAPEPPKLILASTSRYRRELLQRLGLAFVCEAPDVEESARPGEAPTDLAQRLARAKAEAVAARHPESIVIGSDQVAELDGAALGKPGHHASAVIQLRACRGRDVVFHTAVCVAHGRDRHAFVDHTSVRLRDLADAEIERYLLAERPYDCAGSFKCEGLGISLFGAIRSEDPTALIGLPLIALSGALRACGYALP